MDEQTLRELILGTLQQDGAAGVIELACRLDVDPLDVLRVLWDLEQQERVVQVPREGGWGVVEEG